MKNIRIALVYDRVNKIGGAERVLEALHEIWPDAPLYTAVYNKRTAAWADVFNVKTSFLQSIPFSKTHHEWFATITPLAFETFSFDEFEIVISVTSAEAKNIITKPGTIHVCYCLTPTRYLWSGAEEYSNNPHIGLPQSIVKIGLSALLPLLRSWDIVASRRPDKYIAISNRVKIRIESYYQQEVDRVIYPPVNTNYFTQKKTTSDKIPGSYFILVSRLVAYKHTDIVVEACARLGLPLVVIGSGYEKSRLKKLAGNTITFIDSVSDGELLSWLQGCKAFLFAGDEDFGISVVEAQACGKPVIAYRNSAVKEIVIDGKTGILFNEQTVECMMDALNRFNTQWYDSTLCRENAKRFSIDRFKSEMKKYIETIYNGRHI